MPSEINTTPKEIHLFRKALALIQMVYFISLFPRVNNFFGAHGWIKSTYFTDSISFLAISESDYWRWFLLSIIFILLIMFYKGVLNRFGLLIFYLINLSFYDWNPFILHEPQPIMNLFFLSFFFLPMNEKENGKYDPWIKNILIIFLGIYYFLAGAKKLPDPNFINGTAVEYIITWPIMAKSVALNMFFVKHLIWFVRLSDYLTLIFEMSFIFLVFTRLRIYLMFFGIALHVLIYLAIDVGNFSFVMLAWYILLADEAIRAKLNLLKRALLSSLPSLVKRP